MLGEKQPTVRHPCCLVHDELSFNNSHANSTFTSKSFGVTMFLKKDGPLGIEIEPSSGLNP
jgi:hypothetical protein